MPSITGQGHISVSQHKERISPFPQTEQAVSQRRHNAARKRTVGRYHRHIVLPERVDVDKASSTVYPDLSGLEIRLPKAEEAKPKQIEVKVS